MIDLHEHKIIYGNVARYQHIERLGNIEVEDLLNGKCYIQTKIDGANISIAWDHEKNGLILCSRNNLVSLCGNPPHGFNGFVEYCLQHSGIAEVAKKYIIRGEWLVKHSINYSKEKMKHVYVFDVQEYDTGRYITPEEYEPVLNTYGVKYIPVIQQHVSPTVECITELVSGPDDFGAEQKEGIVIKRYDFVNKFGRTVWAKVISADFKIKHKLAMGANRFDNIETHFGALVTQELVLKVIYKIRDDNGTVSIKDMPRVIGMVWYEVFTEQLWDFVRDKKVKEFNFRVAKHLVDVACREHALAYFNGIIS